MSRGAIVRAAAWGLAAVAAINVGVLVRETLAGGWIAYDTRAYWLAARHLVAGSPLYEPALVSTFGAFKYPPIFAQLCMPAAFLPAEVVDWLWRIACFACFRYMSGSWRAAFVATAIWGVFLYELWLGNVTYPLGAACLFALRDRRGAYALPWFAALKFGPALLLVYLWFARPAWRSTLLRSCAVFAAACAISFAIAPSLWFDYAGTFGWEAASKMEAPGIIAFVPGHGGADFAIRLAIAATVTVVAIRRRWAWLAFGAAVVTCPILTLSRLAPLVGVWPLTDAWRRRTGRRILAHWRLRGSERRGAADWAGTAGA